MTGLVLTKLDGTAKGGIALAIAQELGMPDKLIGIGEALEDLRPFDPDDFAQAILEPSASPGDGTRVVRAGLPDARAGGAVPARACLRRALPFHGGALRLARDLQPLRQPHLDAATRRALGSLEGRPGGAVLVGHGRGRGAAAPQLRARVGSWRLTMAATTACDFWLATHFEPRGVEVPARAAGRARRGGGRARTCSGWRRPRTRRSRSTTSPRW